MLNAAGRDRSKIRSRSQATGHVRDAALYISKLPLPEHNSEEWQAAIEALTMAADGITGRVLDCPP
jgi:hypothetical protein